MITVNLHYDECGNIQNDQIFHYYYNEKGGVVRDFFVFDSCWRGNSYIRLSIKGLSDHFYRNPKLDPLHPINLGFLYLFKMDILSDVKKLLHTFIALLFINEKEWMSPQKEDLFKKLLF